MSEAGEKGLGNAENCPNKETLEKRSEAPPP
jgi:hypothetical protein